MDLLQERHQAAAQDAAAERAVRAGIIKAKPATTQD